MPKKSKEIADPLADGGGSDCAKEHVESKTAKKMMKKATGGRGISFTAEKSDTTADKEKEEEDDEDDESSDGEFAPGEEPDSDDESEDESSDEEGSDEDEEESDDEEDALARHEVVEEGEGSVSATAAT